MEKTKEEKKQAKTVSRSVYQKMAEENKRLMADLKTLCFHTPSATTVIVKTKWKVYFQKEATFNSMMKDYATNYFKEHPEHDLTSNALNPTKD